MPSSNQPVHPSTANSQDSAEHSTETCMSRNEYDALQAELEVLRESNSRLELLLQMSNDHCDVIASDLYEKTIELKKAKEIADASSRAKSAFLANMSHEFRTPLNGILGYVQILLRDSTLDTQQKENLKIVQRSSEHLLTLISDVLDLSRIEAGKLTLQEVDFNLPALLKEMIELFEMRAMQKGIGFTYEILPPALSVIPASAVQGFPLLVRTDQKRLRQILLNLLSNAVKFTQKGHIVFRCVYANDYLRFEVEDTGCGIPMGHQRDVFLPFHQVVDSVNHVDGTGLGLSITRNLVNMMNGEFAMESLEEAGSLFWVNLKLSVIQYATDPLLLQDKYFKSHHLDDVLTQKNALAIKQEMHETAAQRLAQFNDMSLPPSNIVDNLLNLAELGDVNEIMRQIESLAHIYPDYTVFFTEIMRMVNFFEIKKLKQFLRDCTNQKQQELR